MHVLTFSHTSGNTVSPFKLDKSLGNTHTHTFVFAWPTAEGPLPFQEGPSLELPRDLRVFLEAITATEGQTLTHSIANNTNKSRYNNLVLNCFSASPSTSWEWKHCSWPHCLQLSSPLFHVSLSKWPWGGTGLGKQTWYSQITNAIDLQIQLNGMKEKQKIWQGDLIVDHRSTLAGRLGRWEQASLRSGFERRAEWAECGEVWQVKRSGQACRQERVCA